MEAFDLALRPAPRRLCRVRVGAGALSALVQDLSRDPPGHPLLVLSDEHVGPLHALPLVDRLVRNGLAAEPLILPAGESAKTRETKAHVEDRLLALGAGRESAIVAVGGGVVGDIAGFVAATWQRGIPVVQVATSLLAMADAALGGKTAVNLPGAKNAIGAFHQPWGVYADIDLLETLPEPDFVAGFAEIVKAASIADARFFARLESGVPALRGRSREALEDAVLCCLRIKAAVVRRDEREAGRRAMLNFGHTVGHALEAASDHSVPHGPAVSIGLAAESRFAGSHTGFPEEQVRRVERLLSALGLPVRLPDGIDEGALAGAARRDKKNRDGRIRCALPLQLGRMPRGAAVTFPIDEAEWTAVLREIGPQTAFPAD